MHIALILAEAFDFRDPIWQFWVGVSSLGLSALAILVTIILAIRGRQRKLLTYEVVSNTSVINVDNDVGEDLKLLLEGQVVTKVRLHVIKLLNAGNTTIESSDYPNQLNFQFDSPPFPQPLIRCGIHRTEPPNLLHAHQLRNLLTIDETSQSLMTLKPPMLNPRQAIYLKVLLMANDRNSTTMDVIGQLKEGIIKKYVSSQTRVTWRAVIAGVLIAFLLGLLISNSLGLISAFTHGDCAIGSIQISGSTSFYNTARDEAAKYKNICPIASIAVNQSSSGTGLSDLQNSTLNIANSEIAAPASANLLDHQVAIIVFALVLNKEVTNVTSLTTQQIRAIYKGEITNWRDVDSHAPDLPIKVIGRATTSGTHASFVNYVLREKESPLPATATIVDRSAQVVSIVANTPGAIGYADLGDAASGSVTLLEINQNAPSPPLIGKGMYQFWAIEHMYTGQKPDGLSESFIHYVTQDLKTSDTFLSLNGVSADVLATHKT